MSNRLTFLSLLTILSFSSCWETIELTPRSFPQLLSYEMSVVKAFDQGMFMTGGQEGFYVKFRDGQDVSHDLNSSDFENFLVKEMKFFATKGKVIYGVNDYYLMKLTDKAVDFYYSNSDAISSYRAFAVDQDGDFIKADYWSAEADGSSYKYLLRLNKWNNAYWDDVLTDISVSDPKLDSPTLNVDANGNLIILTNPTYRVSTWKEGDVEFEKFIPNIQGGSSVKSIHDAHTDGQSFFGFDRELSEDWDVTQAYTFNLNSGILRAVALENATGCNVEGAAFKMTKLLATNDTKSYGWIPVVNNSFSNSPGLIGYVVTFNHALGSCETSAVADMEAFDQSVKIHDVSLMVETNVLMIATSEGLFSYDLATSKAQFYLEKVINL